MEQAQAHAQIRKRALTIINLLVAGALVVLFVVADLLQTLGANTSATAKNAANGAPLIIFGDNGTLSYVPSTLTVRAGTAVEWRGPLNEHPLLSVEELWSRQANGATFSYTFAKPGTYHYYCQIHGGPTGGMSGTVVVQ